MRMTVLYAANTNTQTIADGGVVNYGSIVRRYGCEAVISGGNVVLSGIGYYDINTNLTFTASGAGQTVATLYKDGVAIPGATASVTTVAGSVYSLPISAIIRQKCCCDSTITCVITGESIVASNTAISLAKI